MRKCVLAGWLLAVMLTLNGCSLFAWLYEKPKKGGQSVAEVVQGAAKAIPVWGDALAALIGIGGTIYGANRHKAHKKTRKENVDLKAKHAALIAAGKKDDNKNGVDDALEKPPAAPNV